MAQGYVERGVPGFQEMMVPVLQALEALGGRADTAQLDATAIQLMGLAPEVCAVLHGGTSRTEVSNRMAWARTYLKKYGLIDNARRGVWTFADGYDGRPEDVNPQEIVRFFRESAREALEDPSISPRESRLALDRMLRSELVSYAEEKGRAIREDERIVVEGSDGPVCCVPDAFLPEGLDEIGGPLVCEIICGKPLGLAMPRMRRMLERLRQLDRRYSLLVILGEELSPEETVRRVSGIYVWDYAEFSRRTAHAQSEKASVYIADPRKAILEDDIQESYDERAFAEKRSERLELLKEEYKRQDLTLVLGAGVSIDAGIPGWDALVHRLNLRMLQPWLHQSSLSQRELDLLTESLRDGDRESPLMKLRHIRLALKEDFLTAVHAELYAGVRAPAERRLLLDSIAELVRPTRSHRGVERIITYNFDDLLEQKLRSCRIDCRVVAEESDRVDARELGVFHVHGYLPQDFARWRGQMELVFSEEDYHRVYGTPYCFSSLAQISAFREGHCLFLGCSLTDPNLRRLMDAARLQDAEPRHFAVLPRPFPAGQGNDQPMVREYARIDWSIRDRMFYNMGIHVIWIDDYAEIPAILDGLR